MAKKKKTKFKDNSTKRVRIKIIGIGGGGGNIVKELSKKLNFSKTRVEMCIRDREEAFSKIIPKSKAYDEARKLTKKLKEVLPAQLFNLAIQGKIGGKVIARETVSATRKDVTAPLYGGDITRKKKLLEKQKKSKSKLQAKARVNVPADVFLKVFGS